MKFPLKSVSKKKRKKKGNPCFPNQKNVKNTNSQRHMVSSSIWGMTETYRQGNKNYK